MVEQTVASTIVTRGSSLSSEVVIPMDDFRHLSIKFPQRNGRRFSAKYDQRVSNGPRRSRAASSPLPMIINNRAVPDRDSDAAFVRSRVLASSTTADEKAMREYAQSGAGDGRRIHIADLWKSAKTEGSDESVELSKKAANLLPTKEEEGLQQFLTRTPFNKTSAELSAFAEILCSKFGGADRALLEIVKFPWLPDEHTAEIVRSLITEKDANVEAIDAADTDDTPLHLIAKQGSKSCQCCTANVIINARVSVCLAKNALGLTPVEIAIEKGKCSLAVNLIDSMEKADIRKLFVGKSTLYQLMHSMQAPDDGTDLMSVIHAILRGSEEDCTCCMEGYRFNYDLLEMDSEGNLPDDPRYNGEKSCFSAIVTDVDNRLLTEFGNTRVFRILLDAKWNTYGEKMLMLSTVAYIIFLVLLTFVSVTSVNENDNTSYSDAGGYIRLVCEILVGLTLLAVLYGEIVEMYETKHRCSAYWLNVYNLTQLVSIALLVLVVPFRYAHKKTQWVFLSLGYLVTAIRFFKFVSTSSLVGVYIRVLTGIVLKVMPRFTLIFCFVLFAWAGAFYPALRYHEFTSNNETISDLDLTLETSSYQEILFLGLRILIEGRNLIKYYEDARQLGLLSVFEYLFFLVIVVLILRTILIAEMVTTFRELSSNAVLQLEKNRIWVLPSLESSFFLSSSLSPLKDWRKRFYNKYKQKNHFTYKEMQNILHEEEPNHFLELKQLLTQQNDLLNVYQQQAIHRMTHQTLLSHKANAKLRKLLCTTDAANGNHGGAGAHRRTALPALIEQSNEERTEHEQLSKMEEKLREQTERLDELSAMMQAILTTTNGLMTEVIAIHNSSGKYLTSENG